MKLIKGIIFGVDLFDGLLWFVVLTLGFWFCGLPIPNGNERLIAVAVAGLAAILPDLDMIPYLLVRKYKTKYLFLLGGIGWVTCIALTYGFGKPSFLWLGFAGLLGTLTPIAVQQKVRNRASHWPIWHHPIPVAAICFGLVWMFASDFAPERLWYYESLVMLLVVAHFLHDGLQHQGFPYLAPLTDTHYRWRIVTFERVPDSVVRAHYQRQAKAARSKSSKEDAERRTDKITAVRIVLLLLSAGAVLATLLLL